MVLALRRLKQPIEPKGGLVAVEPPDAAAAWRPVTHSCIFHPFTLVSADSRRIETASATVAPSAFASLPVCLTVTAAFAALMLGLAIFVARRQSVVS